MANKLTVAIFDNDLRCKVGKYPISANGKQIDIVHGGENNFMPKFNSTSYLELPSYKKYLLFGERTYKRIYFAANKGNACIDFSTKPIVVSGPSPEETKQAIGALIATKIGTEGIKIPTWFTGILILNFLFSLLIAHAIGVF